MNIAEVDHILKEQARYDKTWWYAPVWCVEFRMVEVVGNRAFNGERFELVLDSRKIEKMNKRRLSLGVLSSIFSAVVLSDFYVSNELVHWRKSRTSSNEISSEYLRVLVRLDPQSFA